MKAYRMFAVLLVMAGLGLSACQGLPTPAPVSAIIASPTPQPANTAVPVAVASVPDLDQGQAAWKKAQCTACHGPVALGGIGPGLAATRLTYNEFIHVVRTASPPKPAFDEATLPDQAVYNIYAWVRTQLPQAPVASATISTTSTLPAPEEMMAMTIWTCKKCNTCHGVFAQGGASAPALAGLNDPLAGELARMRSTAATVPEHSTDSISDDIFERLYPWLKKGCLTSECSQ